MVSLPETGTEVKLVLKARIPPVAVTLVVAVLMWAMPVLTPAFPLPDRLRWACIFLLAIAAAVVGLAGVAAFRKARTSVNPLAPENCSQLVDSGIFRLTRNPMYLALLFALLGWGLFLENPSSLFMIPVFVLYMNRYQIRPEEEALEAAFGDAFHRYRSSVRKWL
jgi:protein-S-isoprenylcysteine O-methyltransferase Ste14